MLFSFALCSFSRLAELGTDRQALTPYNHLTVSQSLWVDYEDSDVIQIVASDGTVYLTHYMNVLMVRDKR